MMLQGRTGLRGPRLQVAILALVAIALEQVDGVFMHIFLVGVIMLGEVVTVQLLQVVESWMLLCSP